jgi:hypothetical protein
MPSCCGALSIAASARIADSALSVDRKITVTERHRLACSG